MNKQLLFALVFFLTPMLLNAEEYDGSWSNVTKQCDNIGKFSMDIVIENNKLKFLCNPQIHRIEKKGKKAIKITGFGKTYLLGKIDENKITMKFKKTKNKVLKKCTLEFMKVQNSNDAVECDQNKASNQFYDPTTTKKKRKSKCIPGVTCTWADIESEPDLLQKYYMMMTLSKTVPINKDIIESKLIILRSLLDKNLITLGEYHAKRKAILDAM